MRREGNIRRRTSSLQESRLADITLNIHSLLIDLQLRLSDLGLFVLAIALRRCLGSLFILVSLPTLLSPRRCFLTYVSHLGGWLGRLRECTGGGFLVTECLYRESRLRDFVKKMNRSASSAYRRKKFQIHNPWA